MRIGIDVTFLQDQYSNRGIGTYGKELIKRLIQDSTHDWVLFGFDSLTSNLEILKLKKSNNIHFVSLGKPRSSNPFNRIRFKLFWKRKIKKAKLDLYFAPHFERGLPIGITKTAVMVHDIIPYVTKSYSQKGKLLNFFKGIYYRSNLKVARKADLILTNSEFTKRELINKGGFDTKKVESIHLGINESFKKENITTNTREIRRALIMYKITNPYLLYYGGLEENKNISTLLNAFEVASRRHPDLKLVLAGKEFKVGWDNKPKPQTTSASKVLSTIDELKLKHKVIITGEIRQRHLPIILNNAVGFVHLSTYEGFGFSVLEALSAGTPVVAPRRSSYPEVLKNAAEYVQPNDKNKIAEGIFKILQDDSHTKRLKSEGLTISEEYNWDTTTKKTRKLLVELSSKVIPLNIGILVPYFHPFKGGAENNALALAQNMVKKGHKVIVFTSNTEMGDYKAEEEYEGIKILRFNKINSQYYFGIYPTLFKALLKTKLDVLHTHGFGFIWHDFCLISKKILSKKTRMINTPHGPFMAHGDYSLPKRIIKSIYTIIQRLFINKLYHTIIQVNPQQHIWITNYGVKPSKIYYLPNGIHEDYLEDEDTDDIVKKYSLNRKFIITFVGRYEKYKGVQDLIQAIENVSDKKKSIKLVTMGFEGESLKILKEQVSKNNIDKHVELLVAPSDDEVKKILQFSQIFVMPSRWEAFGIAILEAMAKKNAIISTRTEGGNFLITEEENGFLYDFGDTRELTSLINKLIKDKQLLTKIQKNNFKKAQKFSWEKISENYYNLLREVIK